MKILDVGAGFYRYPGSVSIDGNKRAKPDILHDLNSYPWPIDDSSFDVIYTSHCLEHLEDAKKALEEIWRVGCHNALVMIRVPHFSSRVAWTDVEHKRAFSSNMLRGFTEKFSGISDSGVRYKVEKIRLNWQQRMDFDLLPLYIRVLAPFIKAVNQFVSGAANLNIDFCERIWCYYVGGMGEVEFYARINKGRQS